MPRAPRSSAKSASRVSKPFSKRRTRNSLSTVHEKSSDEDEDGIPAEALPRGPRPAKPTLGRLTRSQKTTADYAEFKEIPAVKKRRIAKVQDKPPKRQRTEAVMDSQDEQESESGAEDGEDDESAPQTPDFYKKINKVVLPERDQAQDSGESVQEPGGQEADQEAESQEVERPKGEDSHAQPITSTSQAIPPQPDGRGPRRRQRQKRPVGESVYNIPEEGSPELGSHFMESPSKPRELVARSPQGSPPSESWYGPGEEEHCSSPDSEPENPDEPAPDASTEMVAKDSVNTEPTSKTDIDTIEISSEWAGNLIRRMKYSGWTCDQNWQDDFIVQEGETKPIWLKRHEKFLRPEKCKNLFQHLDHLRELCHDMPKATDIEAQIKYRLEKDDIFNKSFATIESLVTYICKRISDQIPPPKGQKAKWGHPAAETLHKRIIPMLLVVLKESFLAGGALSFDSGNKSDLNEGCFTLSTLTLPLKVVGWLRRLHEVGTNYFDQFPPKPVSDSKVDAQKIQSARTQRERFLKPLGNMQKVLAQAKDRLDHIASAPQRKKETMERHREMQKKHERKRQEERKRRNKYEKEAMEMDQVLLEVRERKEQEERKAQDRQMQLFVGSIQRMKESKVSEASPRDAYFEKYGGWYQWEDERLLQMIRAVEKPDLQALTPLVPERSVDEVAQRIRDLKEKIRHKYEMMKMVPPVWCYQLT